jgi:Domain of unknown function (DUF6647)
MDAMIMVLIGWIAAHSNLAAARPPQIKFVPKHEMEERYYGAKHRQQFSHLQAFYLPDKMTIYLPNTWHADDLRDRSVLLHELVHHLQKTNHFKTSCPAVWERQAYELQFDWLRERGIKDPYALINTNALTVAMLGMCPE